LARLFYGGTTKGGVAGNHEIREREGGGGDEEDEGGGGEEVRRRGEGGWTRMRMRMTGVWLVGSWRKSWGVRKKGWDR
jgi:hypothetical protein